MRAAGPWCLWWLFQLALLQVERLRGLFLSLLHFQFN